MKPLLYPVVLAAALAAGTFAPASAGAHVISQKPLGKGTVTLWQRGSQLGVTLDRDALASLPSTETGVDLVPRSGAFRLVEIDWHPHGHPPAAQPEFHGKPFTASQIWGYDKGRLAFIEAMFSRTFVNANGTWSQAIAKPKSAGITAGPPRTMSVYRNRAGACDIVLSK